MAQYDGVIGAVYLMLFKGTGAEPASVTVADGTVYTPVSPAIFTLTQPSGTTTRAIWAVLLKHWQDAAFANFIVSSWQDYAMCTSGAIPKPPLSGYAYMQNRGRLIFYNLGRNVPGWNSFFPEYGCWCDAGTGLPINT